MYISIRTSAIAAGFARSLQLSSSRTGQAVRTVRQGRRHGPSITYKNNTLPGPLSSSQPGGPPCRVSPLASLAKTSPLFSESLQSPYFYMFMGPRNWFQGMNSASLCSLAGRYDNPIPHRFLAPIDFLKIPSQGARQKIKLAGKSLSKYDIFFLLCRLIFKWITLFWEPC